MNIVIRAKEGMRWTLTEHGLENGRIRARFAQNSAYGKQYEKAVPKRWVDEGYVIEVEDGAK